MRRRLIGHDVRAHAHRVQARIHFGGVADQPDGSRFASGQRRLDFEHRVFEIVGHFIQIARIDAPLRPRPIHFNNQRDALVHGHGERLRAAHPA